MLLVQCNIILLNIKPVGCVQASSEAQPAVALSFPEVPARETWGSLRPCNDSSWQGYRLSSDIVILGFKPEEMLDVLIHCHLLGYWLKPLFLLYRSGKLLSQAFSCWWVQKFVTLTVSRERKDVSLPELSFSFFLNGCGYLLKCCYIESELIHHLFVQLQILT